MHNPGTHQWGAAKSSKGLWWARASSSAQEPSVFQEFHEITFESKVRSSLDFHFDRVIDILHSKQTEGWEKLERWHRTMAAPFHEQILPSPACNRTGSTLAGTSRALLVCFMKNGLHSFLPDYLLRQTVSDNWRAYFPRVCIPHIMMPRREAAADPFA